MFSFEFQVNALRSNIIYESENLSNTTDEEIQYDSDSSVSDNGNSFENENEEHSIIPTTSGAEMLFLVGGHITQSFFKIRTCIFIISLFCIFTFTSHNFTKKCCLSCIFFILYHRF